MVTRMNALRPVNKLPDEILVSIFAEATADARDPATLMLYHATRMEEYTLQADVEPLFMLAGVCRRWRALMLGFPAFWTSVDCNDPERLARFKMRAQRLPMSLLLDLDRVPTHQMTREECDEIHDDEETEDEDGADGSEDDSEDNESEDQEESSDEETDGDEYDMPAGRTSTKERVRAASDMLKRLASRIRRIDITSRFDETEVMVLLSSVLIPNLECLTVCLPHARQGTSGFGERPLEKHSRSCVFFSSLDSSPLKALALSRAHLWFPAARFPELTHLYLSFEYKYVSMSDLLVLLKSTPNISFLHIASARLGLRQALQPNPAVVPLNKLRILAFTDCPAPTFEITQFLELAPSVLVRANRIYYERESNHLALCGSNDFGGFTELDLRMVRNEFHILADGPTSSIWIHGQGREDPMGVVRFDFDWERIIKGFHHTLPLANLTSLRLCDWKESPHTLISFLKHTPRLKELAIRSIMDYVHGLADRTDPLAILGFVVRAFATTTPLLCPELRALTICSNAPPETDLVPYRKMLQKMLAARAQAGTPLHTLILKPEGGDAIPQTFPATARYAPIRRAFRGLGKYVPELRVVMPDEPVPGDDALRQKLQEKWEGVAEKETRYWSYGRDYRFAPCVKLSSGP